MNEGSFQGASAVYLDLGYVISSFRSFGLLYNFDDAYELFDDYRYKFICDLVKLDDVDHTFDQINGFLRFQTSEYWNPRFHKFNEDLECYLGYLKYYDYLSSLPDDSE